MHISDTHEMLGRVSIPKGDLLIHSGDWTGRGSVESVEQFNDELGELKKRFKHGIIVVPGNHDGLAEDDPHLCRKLLTNATLLIDEEVTVGGLRIYGSPHTPAFNSWWFNSTESQLKEQWAAIPKGLDILITHGPPHGILDRLRRYDRHTGGTGIELLGCRVLTDAVLDKKPRLHLFGHIHDGYGALELNGTWFSNASICTEQYRPINAPIVFKINKKTVKLVKERKK